MLLVWPIVFTALFILYFTPSLFGFHPVEFSPFGSHVALLLNVGFLFTVIYAVFYVCLAVKAGSLAALLCVFCWISSSFLASRLGFSHTWKKRAPALLDNLARAFSMAPFCVLLEALQKFFRYELYPGFHVIVQAEIASEITYWHDKK